jgi:hypothetical protein
MLILTNSEGEKFNPIIDNYLILQTASYASTAFNEVEQLLTMLNTAHSELVVVETSQEGLDLLQFFENIGKLIVCKVISHATGFYLTIQKSVL